MTVSADAKAIIKSLIEQPPGFERKATKIETMARAVLKHAGIVDSYQAEQPAWITRKFGNIAIPSWRAAAVNAKFDCGSPEYLAGEVLDCLHRLRLWVGNENTDMALDEAVTLGALSMGFGKKMLSRRAGEAASPRTCTEVEVYKDWEFEMSKTPRPKLAVADETIAKRHRISARTVRRVRSAK